jgi:hypothetical protein
LLARVAQARDLDQHVVAEPQPGASGKAQKVHAPRGDVFSHLAGVDGKSSAAKLGEQLLMQQAYLAQVRLMQISERTRSMLDGLAEVRIATDALPFDKLDFMRGAFGKRVFRV